MPTATANTIQCTRPPPSSFTSSLFRLSHDGMHRMECTRWNAHDGMHTIERIQWNAYNGIRTIASAQWSWYDGIHTMEPVQWNPHLHDRIPLDGVRPMECARWKQWNAHEETRAIYDEICMVKSARWNPHNGVRTMDPHNRIRRTIEST